MAYGQSIRIYLAEGSVTGIRHAEVINWTGQAIACPRPKIPELVKWDEARRPGIYFLFGFDDVAEKPLAYIGEGEVVLVRLQNHVANKDNWNEVVLFSSKDDNLTKAHVKYLESKLVGLAKAAKRYVIENGNEPQASTLPRGDRDSMDSFLEQIRLLLGVLGHKVLEPVSGSGGTAGKKTSLPSDQAPTSGAEFAIRSKAADGQARQTDEGLVVLAGSRGRAKVQLSMPPSYLKIREKLLASGVLRRDGDWIEFVEDYLFPNPTPAASVLTGSSINGRMAWRNKDGVSLGELEQGATLS